MKETVTVFKKIINKEHCYYVEYKNKEFILKNRNYEKAKKEAYDILEKYNKEIIIL